MCVLVCTCMCIWLYVCSVFEKSGHINCSHIFACKRTLAGVLHADCSCCLPKLLLPSPPALSCLDGPAPVLFLSAQFSFPCLLPVSSPVSVVLVLIGSCYMLCMLNIGFTYANTCALWYLKTKNTWHAGCKCAQVFCNICK